MPTGGDDRLPEHLTPFDDRPPPVAPGDADEGDAAVGADVQLVDQMRGIAPGGEPLDGHIPWGVTLATIGDLDPHLVLVEGSESGQRAPGGRGFAHGVPTPFAFEPLEIDVGEREEEDGRLTGLREAQARIGLGDQTSLRPGARPVRVSLDAHRAGATSSGVPGGTGGNRDRRNGDAASLTEERVYDGDEVLDPHEGTAHV